MKTQSFRVRAAERICRAIFPLAIASVCFLWLAPGFQGGSTLHAATTPFVQEKDKQITSGTSNAVTFASPTTAGNLIAVYVIWDSAGTVSISDSSGNTYASAVGPTLWNSRKYSVQVFYARNIKGGADTVTARFSTALTSFGIVYIHEYSQLDQVAPVDVTAAAVGTGTSISSGSAATSSANDLLFGAAVSMNTVTRAGTGFSVRSTAQGNMTEDRLVSTQGSYSATATNSGGGWAMQMVAFRLAGSQPADITPPTVPAGLSAVAVSSSQINLSWAASTDPDNTAAQLSYRVYRNGTLIGTTPAGTTTWQDSALQPSTTYTYAVSAVDPSGNASAQSGSVQATTTSGQTDNQPPTVTVTSPSNNQTVSGTWTITANAADNVGVAGVQFLLDGSNLGPESLAAPYSTSWNTASTADGGHVLTAVARDAVGNRTTSAPVTASVSNGLRKPYTTTFPLTENPISEGGRWINGQAVGLDWADIQTVPGLAFGTEKGTINFDDSTALLAGSWGPDQTVEATVHSVNQPSDQGIYEEVELRLRSSLSAHRATGYEINFRCNKTVNGYMQVVRWNGPFGNFTYLDGRGGSQYGVQNGDVVKASMIGNVITVYLNGVQIAQTIDNTFTSGNPGMGFYVQGTSGTNVNRDYGFSSFTASDGSSVDTAPPSVPSGLTATAVSSSKINLSWNASTDDVGVIGYQIFRNNAQIATSSTTSFSDTGLVANTPYSYAVAAYDVAGNVSSPSSPATATTLQTDTTPPSAPTILQSSNVTSTSLSISWSASTDNVAVAGYQIFRNGNQVGTTSSTTFNDSGLAPGTTYFYTVAAFDTSDNVSVQSPSYQVTTTTGPLTPPSFIQSNHNQTAQGTTTSATFNASTVAGRTIVAYLIWDNTGGASLTDTRGDTFVPVSAPTIWAGKYSAQVFYASGIAGGTDTVTARFNTSVSSFGVLYIHEYAGISTTNPVDVTVAASGSSTLMNSGSIATTSASDLLFGAGVSDNVVTAAGSGFTARDLTFGNITEDRVAGSPGSVSATATHSGSMWGMQLVAFRAAQ